MTAHVDRLIVGAPDEVAAVLRSAAHRGVLVAVTVPRPVAGGRVVVVARMVATAPAEAATGEPSRLVRHRVGRSRSIARCAGIAAVAMGVVALSGALLYAVVWLVVAAWPLLLAAAVVLFVLRRVQVRVGVCCPGLHCPGCRH